MELTSIPEPVNGVVEVAAGSTVLFLNETDASDLDGQTTYSWNVPGITVGPWVAGPVFAKFDTPGTFTVSLGIVTLDGDLDLGEATLTVVVSTAPPLIPELMPGNSCTMPDTLDLFTDVVVFQTQSGTSSCTCIPSSWGPLVTLAGTDQYPAGTISHIYWGGPGSAANGGTAAFTTQTGFPTATEDLTFYPGQTSPAGHYVNQGSYNLVHVVEFPNGSTYSDYYVVSWGAAFIDQCANAAQSVCFPSDYPLCFDTQAPGTTYSIDWGDGSPIEQYTYPHLPTIPNQLGHAYDESCSEGSFGATPYVITIEAENACDNLTTVNSQGPFFVSTAPLPEFTMDSESPVCQNGNIAFTDNSFTGFEAGGAGCFDEYFRVWTINGSSNPNGFGYTIQGGDLGDAFWFEPGTEVIDVQFTEPGTYDVTLTVSNTFCDPLSVTQTVQVEPAPVVGGQVVTVCSGEGFSFTPDAPPAILPEGTTYSWSVQANPNVSGESAGSGEAIFTQLTNLTSSTQTVEYTVVPTASGGCAGEPFSLSVNVLSSESLQVTDELEGQVLCVGEEVVLEASVTFGELVGSVQWFAYASDPADAEELEADENGGLTLTESDGPASWWVYFQASGSAGCGDVVSAPAQFVWVDPPSGELVGDQVVCPGEAVEAI